MQKSKEYRSENSLKRLNYRIIQFILSHDVVAKRVAPDTISRLANALGVNANELTADASIRVNSAPEMVELQQKVAAGQATEQEKQAWLEANLKRLRAYATLNRIHAARSRAV